MMSDLQIVGFDGPPLGYCARTLPVVCDVGRKLYTKKSDDSRMPPSRWISESEFREHVSNEAITELAPPRPYMDGCLIVFLKMELLKAAEVAIECVRTNTIHEWRLNDSMLAVAMLESDATEMLNRIGLHLSRVIEAHLVEVLKGHSEPHEDVLFDMAFSAARNPQIRRGLYLQFCALRKQQGLASSIPRIQRLLIRHEFTEWEKDAFLRDLANYLNMLTSRVIVTSPIAPDHFPETLPRAPYNTGTAMAVAQKMLMDANLLEKESDDQSKSKAQGLREAAVLVGIAVCGDHKD